MIKKTKFNNKFTALALTLGMAASLGFSACDSTDDSTSALADCENTLSGEQTADVTIPAGSTWCLSGAVKFTSGTTLTIGEGTTIYGDNALDTVLIIDRGAKINAVGTATAPVVFTSPVAEGLRASGDWGGIVINGYASYNAPGGTGEGEGNSGTFGGTDDADNSGTLQFVRVEYAGKLFSTEDELNGVAFQAVGSGTTVSHLQVHKGKDDAVEFFGGTVNVTNLVVSQFEDDGIDWTSGWTGSVQNAVVLFHGGTSSDPRGLEGDNDGDAPTLTPVSNPSIWNVTMIGNGVKGSNSNIAKIRRGSNADLGNFYIANMCGIKFAFESDQTIANATINGVLIEQVMTDEAACSNAAAADADVFSEETTAGASDTLSQISGTSYNASMTLLSLDSASDFLVASLAPGADQTGQTPPPSLDTSATYFGGVSASDDWTAGWTSFPQE